MDEIKNIEERTRVGTLLSDVRKTCEWVDKHGIKRVGMTQEELSKRTGIKQGNIARIECGRYNFTFDTLSVLAGAIGWKVDLTKK